MKSSGNLTVEDIKHLAKLANLKLTDKELNELLPQITSVIEFVSKVQSLNTENTPETSQVTGLENIFRQDTLFNKIRCSINQNPGFAATCAGN